MIQDPNIDAVKNATVNNLYGDGNAAAIIVSEIVSRSDSEGS